MLSKLFLAMGKMATIIERTVAFLHEVPTKTSFIVFCLLVHDLYYSIFLQSNLADSQQVRSLILTKNHQNSNFFIYQIKKRSL